MSSKIAAKSKRSRPPKLKAPKDHAVAFHGNTAEGQVVGIGNLRVLLTQDDDAWFAQGLEIDYAAQGSSIEDVQHRFETGLEATIREHLKVFGGLSRLLKVAPPEVWQDLFSDVTVIGMRHSQVSLHPVFSGVMYFAPKAA